MREREDVFRWVAVDEGERRYVQVGGSRWGREKICPGGWQSMRGREDMFRWVAVDEGERRYVQVGGCR